MRRLPLGGIALLTLSACTSEHPREVVGSWVLEDRGRYTRSADTITASPRGRGSFGSHYYAYQDGDTNHIRRKSGEMFWRVTANRDGRYLCIREADKDDEYCMLLRVIPGTALILDSVRFERVR